MTLRCKDYDAMTGWHYEIMTLLDCDAFSSTNATNPVNAKNTTNAMNLFDSTTQ